MRGDASWVPVIDLAPYYAGKEAGRQSVARAIGDACENVGFLIVRNHRIPVACTQAIRAAARAFFDLPDEQKTVVEARAGEDRGWRRRQAGSLARTLDGSTGRPPPDLRENYFTGPFETPNPATVAPEARRYYLPNVWPAAVPGMAAAFRAYYAEACALARDLLRLGALSLGLSETYFDGCQRRPISQLVAVNYPALSEPPLPGQLRAGAHTDFGALTLLLAEDRPGGLQVRTPQGQWEDVRPEPGTLVVNLGDLMAHWTNDRWRSTLHRVLPPPAEEATRSRRQSIVFFHHPDPDAVIECLPGCSGPGRPPRYAPTTAGHHLGEKLRAAYGDR